MEICARVYRPRRARESPLFRLVEQHLEEFLRVYPSRFAQALFRERLLARLVERHAISEDLVRKLLAWRHPGL